MSQGDDLVQQAIAAYKGGQKDHSRSLLLQAIEIDERHEHAWLWLSAVVDDLDEQQICLENVLALNPANEQARKGLEIVNRKIAEKQAKASEEDELALPDSAPSYAPVSEPAPPSPAGTSLPGSPDDLPDWAQPAGPGEGSNAVSELNFEDWLAAAAQAEDASPYSTDSPATSVDWGRSGGPAVYGSGRKVELPSPQEFDEWVQGLNLSESPKAAPPDFAPDAEGKPELFSGAEPSLPVEGVPLFGEDTPAEGTPTPDFDSLPSFDEDDWLTEDESARIGNVFTLDDDDEQSEGGSFNFDFDAEEPTAPAVEAPSEADEDDDDWLSERLGTGISVAPAFSTPDLAAAGAEGQDYFSYIPDGIEARSGISVRGLLLLAAIVVLLVLNVLSFGLLIL